MYNKDAWDNLCTGAVSKTQDLFYFGECLQHEAASCLHFAFHACPGIFCLPKPRALLPVLVLLLQRSAQVVAAVGICLRTSGNFTGENVHWFANVGTELESKYLISTPVVFQTAFLVLIFTCYTLKEPYLVFILHLRLSASKWLKAARNLGLLETFWAILPRLYEDKNQTYKTTVLHLVYFFMQVHLFYLYFLLIKADRKSVV